MYFKISVVLEVIAVNLITNFARNAEEAWHLLNSEEIVCDGKYSVWRLVYGSVFAHGYAGNGRSRRWGEGEDLWSVKGK